MPLKTCKHCGRIHKKDFICPMKPVRTNYKKTNEDKFRNTQAWQKKRRYIREDRDKGLCQVCMRKLHNTIKKYNYNDLEVHHIVPLREDYDLRLEDSNLITICEYHHELAEAGTIPRYELKSIVKEQDERLQGD